MRLMITILMPGMMSAAAQAEVVKSTGKLDENKKIAAAVLVLSMTACTKEAPNKPETPITPQAESSRSIRLAGVERVPKSYNYI
jgi:hypothetical protein